jgi:uncharacterized protein
VSAPHLAALEELDQRECLRRLSRGGLGRVAVNMPGWPPLIRPVRFLWDEASQSVVFRCAEGSKLHALARARRAAFEIDGTDRRDGGWSVIVIGPVEEVTSAAERGRLAASALRSPGAGEARGRWLRIRASAISGRHVRAGAAQRRSSRA